MIDAEVNPKKTSPNMINGTKYLAFTGIGGNKSISFELGNINVQ